MLVEGLPPLVVSRVPEDAGGLRQAFELMLLTTGGSEQNR